MKPEEELMKLKHDNYPIEYSWSRRILWAIIAVCVVVAFYWWGE